MAEVLRITTEPTSQARGRFARCTSNSNPQGPGHLWAMPRRMVSAVETVEAVHNAALAAGYESELVEYRDPQSWAVRVRKPGDPEGLPFVSESFAPLDLGDGELTEPAAAGR